MTPQFLSHPQNDYECLIHISGGHEGSVYAVAFAPDGRIALSGSDDKTLRLWDVANGTEIRRFEGHSRAVCTVAFAPDGRTVISGSGSPFGTDTTLRLWDVANGTEIRRFEGHSEWVSVAAFAPDGRTVLSASSDKTLRLWDVATGAALAILDLDAPLYSLAIVATIPPLLIVGDEVGGIWVLRLHLAQ